MAWYIYALLILAALGTLVLLCMAGMLAWYLVYVIFIAPWVD